MGERGRVAADRAGARHHILIGLIAVVVGHSCLIFLYVSSRLYSGPLARPSESDFGLRIRRRLVDMTNDKGPV